MYVSLFFTYTTAPSIFVTNPLNVVAADVIKTNNSFKAFCKSYAFFSDKYKISSASTVRYYLIINQISFENVLVQGNSRSIK